MSLSLSPNQGRVVNGRGASMMLAFAGVTAIAPPPSASSCDVEPPGYLLPAPGVLAPRNVRPIVRLPSGEESPMFVQPLVLDAR